MQVLGVLGVGSAPLPEDEDGKGSTFAPSPVKKMGGKAKYQRPI